MRFNYIVRPNQRTESLWPLKIFRTIDEFSEILSILTELGQRLPQLRDNPIYAASIPHYLSIAAYKFITAGPRTTSGGLECQTAFGFVTFYRAPMSNWTRLGSKGIVLAVEAFWFKDDNVDSQLPVWSFMASLARKMGFHGVCIAKRSINTPASLDELLRRGDLGGDPILPDSTALQADVEGIYSAFANGSLSQKAFLAPCIRIFPQGLFGFYPGSPSFVDAVFYRGEGRLVNGTQWDCRNLKELAALFMERGFPARASGSFAAGPYRNRSCTRAT